MLNAARHHDAFSDFQRNDTVAKLDPEPAAPDHEEFVRLLVVVPRIRREPSPA
jgi:hypothetical protein